MKFAISLAVFLSVSYVALAADTKIVLRAERDDQGAQLQQALVFDGEKITLSRNSNFMCSHSNPVLLGVFESKSPTKLSGTRTLVEQLALRVEKRPPGNRPGVDRPHELRIFLGSRELTGDQNYSGAVQRMIEDGCEPESADWAAKSAVEVALKGSAAKAVLHITEITDGVRGKMSEQSAVGASCKTFGKKLSCVISNWGRVTFKAP